MEPNVCFRCAALVEDQGIHHRRRLFCSDECCEAFEDLFLARGGPDSADLAEDFDHEFEVLDGGALDESDDNVIDEADTFDEVVEEY